LCCRLWLGGRSRRLPAARCRHGPESRPRPRCRTSRGWRAAPGWAEFQPKLWADSRMHDNSRYRAYVRAGWPRENRATVAWAAQRRPVGAGRHWRYPGRRLFRVVASGAASNQSRTARGAGPAVASPASS
jgi:hypothetical protein